MCHEPPASAASAGACRHLEVVMNVVFLFGRLSSAPRCCELPSGTVRWNLEVSCTMADGRASGVPVSWEGSVPATWAAGTEVVVAGSVRRRFFRSGGATQSRTEVLAVSVIEVTRRRSVERAVARAVGVLGQESVAPLRSILGTPAA
jgi:single-strand DNA-binding protein